MRVPAGAHVVAAEPDALAVEGEVLGHPEDGQRRAALLSTSEVALNLPGCGANQIVSGAAQGRHGTRAGADTVHEPGQTRYTSRGPRVV